MFYSIKDIPQVHVVIRLLAILEPVVRVSFFLVLSDKWLIVPFMINLECGLFRIFILLFKVTVVHKQNQHDG